MTEYTVHNECDTYHVTTIFQNGKEEEQRHDDRQEHEHAADAGEHAVDDEAMYHGVDAVGRERGVHDAGQRVDAELQQVGQPLADDVERDDERRFKTIG